MVIGKHPPKWILVRTRRSDLRSSGPFNEMVTGTASYQGVGAAYISRASVFALDIPTNDAPIIDPPRLLICHVEVGSAEPTRRHVIRREEKLGRIGGAAIAICVVATAWSKPPASVKETADRLVALRALFVIGFRLDYDGPASSHG